MEQELKVIRKPEIFNKVSLSDPTIWRLERQGKFPKRIKLGGNSVGWLSHEVNAWLEDKAAARSEKPDENERKLFKKRQDDTDAKHI